VDRTTGYLDENVPNFPRTDFWVPLKAPGASSRVTSISVFWQGRHRGARGLWKRREPRRRGP
jgi:hypothetical protein